MQDAGEHEPRGQHADRVLEEGRATERSRQRDAQQARPVRELERTRTEPELVLLHDMWKEEYWSLLKIQVDVIIGTYEEMLGLISKIPPGTTLCTSCSTSCKMR